MANPFRKLINLAFGAETPPKYVAQLYDELPTTYETRISYQWPKFKDKVSDLDPDAYSLIRTVSATRQPLEKLGINISMWNLKVMEGEEEGTSERALMIKKILTQAKGLPFLIRDMVWGFAEGVTFHLIQKGKTREGPDPLIVPSFRNGFFHKINAGGSIAPYIDQDGKWVVKQRQYETTIASEEAKEGSIPRGEIIVFRPGNGTNPEGDLDTALVLYKMAQFYDFVEKILRAYTERHGLPREVFKMAFDQVKPTDVTGRKTTGAQKIASLRPGEVLGMGIKELLETVEPNGSSAQFLLDLKREIEGDAHRLILLQELTSSTKTAGPAGSSTVQLKEEQKAELAAACAISETLTDDLLPWILAHNEGTIPALGESDDEVWFKLEPPEQEDSMDTPQTDDTQSTDSVEDMPMEPGDMANGA